jgi:hypothetical protein
MLSECDRSPFYDSTSSFKQQKRGLIQQPLTGKKRVKLDEPWTLKVK